MLISISIKGFYFAEANYLIVHLRPETSQINIQALKDSRHRKCPLP